MGTDRARNEAKQSKVEWLDLVVEGLPVGVVQIRASRIIPNRRARALLGVEPSDEAASDLARLASMFRKDEGTPLSIADFQSMLASDTPRWEDRVLHREDGSKIPVVVSGWSPGREADGRSAGVFLVEDIRVFREAERARSEWATVVSHDLKQPLTVISTYAGLLARQAGDEGARTKAEHILSSVATLTRMISDLTDAIRMESRTLEVKKERVDAAALFERIGERAAELVTGNRLHVKIPRGPLEVDADPKRIEQVMNNLISNAEKFSYPDTPIDVGLRSSDGQVEFWVANEGEGIDPGDLPRLFDRFHRGERVIRGGVSGLGLGLYIAKGLVEEHAGRIWAESEPGKTTRISFVLPLKKANKPSGTT